MTIPTRQFSIDGAAQLVTWTLAQGEEGAPISLTDSADRTVQVLGTFGGASVVIEGSLEHDPVNYATLTDPQGNNLSIAAAKLESITEMVNYIRPRVVGGDGTTTLTVHMLLRRTNK